jgi:predicted nucleic acid-binding protein
VNGFVCVDACVAVQWVLPEDDSDVASDFYTSIAAANDTIIVPPHMPVEVVNAIRKKVRRGEVSPADGEDALSAFLALPVSIAVPEGMYESALLLAQRFDRPTVYDTHYVALAQIAGCELWTADKKLLNALNNRLAFVKPLASFRG